MAVKRIFRYLEGCPDIGLWYPKDDNFDLIAFSDSDHGGCKIAAKSTSAGSTLQITRNPVQHSKTKHIEIKYHFIRDCYEKKLIDVVKIHTDHQRADLFTKAFDKSPFDYLLLVNGIKVKLE
ncbi:uncharacterized protein LOC110942995 [Helianthus annuus]|uniref:uncharacterized protein LOC110942995 n=1 Tax=Helianthus annuus TaxID=4232 RepID=UPI000B901616|nr:uncharacterized protein LOC110942995 [Helianthus annuus]